MKAIAEALVYAVTYINLRNKRESYDDGDVGALESIAGFLNDASSEEIEALAAASKRLLEDERSTYAREEFVRDYEAWMADMFGEEWNQNN